MIEDDIFKKTNELKPFTKDIFDLNNDIDLLEINERNDKTSCYISKKGNKYIIYNIFIFYNGPKVKFKCSVDFSKKSDSGKYIPRITFYKEKNNGEIKETKNNKIIIGFVKSGEGLENFWDFISFLKSQKDLVDTGNFDEKYRVINNSSVFVSEFKTKEEFEKVEELKKLKISNETLKKYLSDERSKIVEKFREMLEDDKIIDEYKKSFGITKDGQEVAWHHFLKNNDWVLGMNIDVKFIRDFTNEVNIGVSDTTGSGSPKTDLMGISDFTVLVELKTANTDFFTESKGNTGRANTWSFTPEIIDGISQCLGQKFDWDKNHRSKKLIKKDESSGNDEVLDQDIHMTVDPKSIFIVGNKQKELPKISKELNIFTKRETLERFRRNNRNVEIVSFDELYERAYFIVHNEMAPKLNFK